MSEFRNRSNGTYILDANWEALYILTKPDLLFYRNDLNFLDNLIDKYLIWISNKKNSEAVRKIDNNIFEISKKCTDLLQRVDTYITHLANLMEDTFKYDSHQFRAEHQLLENDFTNFVKAFRTNKKEVIEVTKMVIESDEFVRLIVIE